MAQKIVQNCKYFLRKLTLDKYELFKFKERHLYQNNYKFKY